MGLLSWLFGKKKENIVENVSYVDTDNENRIRNLNKVHQQNIKHVEYIDKLKKFYKENGYENIPYIESEESAKYVLNNINGAFGAVLVPKEYMNNIDVNGVNYTFGEIVLLWWLSSRKNISNIPHYFARTYGIDASSSINKMINTGLLNKNKRPSPEGLKVIDDHKDIVDKHRAKKSWSGTGPVEYDYSPVLKGKAKETEMLRQVKKSFDKDIKFYKESKINLFEWMPAKNPCPICKKIANTDIGYGKGIYKTNQSSTIRKQLHFDCRCATVPYDPDLPPVH